ncbi:MAG: 4'-phosphopantetheinyl transferase superfamily protein [Lachnospiraceae bacterium]|jgi:4'-phosphopantetheinyl transferase|nr:4'-phosphopantetheinyl transferase superfamily protein [Lachnospiraceae bacterium]
MVTVYYAEVFTRLAEERFKFYLDKVEEERKKKILLMKNEEGRLQSLTAGSLLYLALCGRIGDEERHRAPFSIGYEKSGKPYLREYPDIHFNLSHSGAYVCCGLSDSPVGVDIQKITDVKKGLAGRFFTEEDNRRLNNACSGEERKALFFRMWSIKESFIKLTGRGMAQGLDTFEIDWEKNRVHDRGKSGTYAYFTTWDALTGYSACVCSWEPVESAEWKRITAGFLY